MKLPTYADLKDALSTLVNGLTRSMPEDRNKFFRHLQRSGDCHDMLHGMRDAYEESLDGTKFSTLPPECEDPPKPLKKGDKFYDVTIDPVPVVPKQTLHLDKKGRVGVSELPLDGSGRVGVGESFDLKVDPKGKKLNKVKKRTTSQGERLARALHRESRKPKVSVSKLSHALNQARLNRPKKLPVVEVEITTSTIKAPRRALRYNKKTERWEDAPKSRKRK